MTIRFLSIPPAPVALAVLLAVPLWTSATTAQVDTPQIAPAPPAFRSAFEGYQPYADEKTVNWKDANDTAARIGGWRAYAKEASQLEPATTPAADAATPHYPRAANAGPAKP